MLIIDRTNSLGLWTFGKEFYDAAELVTRNTNGISNVAYYLVCHSLELSLKAYLRGKDYALEDLKFRLGHDLKSILVDVEKENINDIMNILPEYRMAVSMISELYKKKEFEYIETGPTSFPSIEVLLRFADAVLVNTREFCLKHMNHHNDNK